MESEWVLSLIQTHNNKVFGYIYEPRNRSIEIDSIFLIEYFWQKKNMELCGHINVAHRHGDCVTGVYFSCQNLLAPTPSPCPSPQPPFFFFLCITSVKSIEKCFYIYWGSPEAEPVLYTRLDAILFFIWQNKKIHQPWPDYIAHSIVSCDLSLLVSQVYLVKSLAISFEFHLDTMTV